MRRLHLTVKFIEPFRVTEWHDRKYRNSVRFLRGYSYARWHKIGDKEGFGRPYIPGTLVRSAIIRAAEELLWMNNGQISYAENDKNIIALCCPGEFEGNTAQIVKPRNGDEEAVLKKLRMRRRATLTWDNHSNCKEENPCPFCRLLGQYERIREKENKRSTDLKKNINFSNFDAINRSPVYLKDAAEYRIVNRVDQFTGKAEDFFGIWEMPIQSFDEFAGEICLSKEVEDNKGLHQLIINAAAFVDKLSGGLCYMTVKIGDIEPEADMIPIAETQHSPQPEPAEKSDPYQKAINDYAEKITQAFEDSGKLVHLRLFSDAVRELRRDHTLKFPKGVSDRKGEATDHFIWDIEVRNQGILRYWLPQIMDKIETEYGVLRRRLCENLGQAIYMKAREKSPEQFPSERPLGTGYSMKAADEACPVIRTQEQGACCEHLIIGKLVAQTPFFFGWEKEKDNSDTPDQTSLKLLRTKTGHLRLARSALRGILRRDIKAAFGGIGCRAELAAKTPCSCPVCALMKSVTIRDSVSTYSEAPKIRHRIRLDHAKGIVDKGALFDVEVGPAGAAFPFELRLRTSDARIPAELQTVLAWWSNGLAFLSGEAGTGKGRFQLTELKECSWDLRKNFSDYAKTCGGRKDLPPTLGELKVSADKPHTWQESEKINLCVNSPFLTKDPILSLLDLSDNEEGIDALCYKSVRLDENGTEHEEYLLKSESFRGILRTAVGKRMELKDGKARLIHVHEDFECLLCKLFGNEHEAGKLRVEDLRIIGESKEKLIDRVAIDRFTGGAKDQHKFDMKALIGTPNSSLKFEGMIWKRNDLTPDETEALNTALRDIRDGYYGLGGLFNVGLGWVNYYPAPDLSPKQRGEENEVSMGVQKAEAFELIKSLQFSLFDETFMPHYFLPFGQTVIREKAQPGHAFFDEKRHTGKLICTMKTKTPVIIPDAEEVEPDERNPDHKKFKFFNLNGERCIPGSEIRGMVSSVFEALTNSCFRIFDETKRLSWRMKAQNLEQWKPGRIFEKEGQLWVEEMEEIRLPVYDNQKLGREIKRIAADGYYRDKQLTRTDTLVNQYSDTIRALLKQDKSLIFARKEFKCFKCAPHGMDNIALTEAPDKGCTRNKSKWIPRGYIHFTGPNKVEVEKMKDQKTSGDLKTLSNDPLNISHNIVELDVLTVNSSKRGEVQRKRAIPKYQVISDGFVYTMSKRCERVFIPIPNSDKYAVSGNVADKFEQLCEEYQNNSEKIPEVFRTRLPKNGKLNNGDLIYFRKEDDKATEIIPVRISRTVDDAVMAKKLPDDLRPCVREITDEKIEKHLKKEGMKELFQHHPDGLCPACSLFGTPFYKGRVAFGFAFASDKNKPLSLLENGNITLPLLERPRATWVMPDKDKKVPGRKFYVHHQGWKQVVDNSDNEQPGENNKTVQALKQDQELTFEVRFENLDDWELGLLLYSLQLESGLAHKLGMGKALGFGSVEIAVREIHTLETILDQNILRNQAKQKLRKIWGVQNDNELSDRLEKFFKLLLYIQSDVIKVRYPKLKREKEETEDGYMELKDQEAFKPENRQKKMTTPWTSWGGDK